MYNILQDDQIRDIEFDLDAIYILFSYENEQKTPHILNIFK